MEDYLQVNLDFGMRGLLLAENGEFCKNSVHVAVLCSQCWCLQHQLCLGTTESIFRKQLSFSISHLLISTHQFPPPCQYLIRKSSQGYLVELVSRNPLVPATHIFLGLPGSFWLKREVSFVVKGMQIAVCSVCGVYPDIPWPPTTYFVQQFDGY